MIHQAFPPELPQLLKYMESAAEPFGGLDPEYAKEFLGRGMLTGDLRIWYAGSVSEPSGLIAGVVFPSFFKAELAVQCLGWKAEKAATAAALMRTLERWAVGRGARRIFVSLPQGKNSNHRSWKPKETVIERQVA